MSVEGDCEFCAAVDVCMRAYRIFFCELSDNDVAFISPPKKGNERVRYRRKVCDFACGFIASPCVSLPNVTWHNERFVNRSLRVSRDSVRGIFDSFPPIMRVYSVRWRPAISFASMAEMRLKNVVPLGTAK